MERAQQVAHDTTVVVPTVGRPTLAACLERLAAGTTVPREVIVVHQGVDTQTASICAEASARGLPTRHLRHPGERGAARARNRGIASCTTPYVAFVDDDCLADERWLETVVTELRADPATVVTGQILPGGAGAPSVITDTEPRRYDRPTARRDILYTGAMGAATKRFDEVGPFSETAAVVPAAEDNEWAYRALSSGTSIQYVPSACVTHLDWRDPAGQLDVERRYARGQGGFYGLHLRRGDPFIARRAACDLARQLRRLLLGVVHRDRVSRQLALRSLVGLLRGIATGVREGAPERVRRTPPAT